MTGPEQLPTNRSAEARGESCDQGYENPSRHPSQNQLRRWAALIATGETEFPDDLDPDDRDLLLGHCRVLLRDRLVSLVARAIALDIHRGGGENSKD